MKLQNISKKLLTGVVFTAALVSCSEDKMDEINKDHNHTTAVPAKMILTDVMTSTAFSVVSGDFNLYGGMWNMRQVRIINSTMRKPVLLVHRLLPLITHGGEPIRH